MQTTLAQMIALTCFGNALLRGKAIDPFFPGNSTCQFCESIKFIAVNTTAAGEARTVTVAETPDEWFAYLRRHSVEGFRLQQKGRNNPQFPDRLSAGFVGGGKQWKIEVLRGDAASDFWLDRWVVGDRNAPDRRIWKVAYLLCETGPTAPLAMRSLNEIVGELRLTLERIRVFSERENCGGFTKCFADAIRALDDPDADIGYHKDLFPPGLLKPEAVSLLKAAQSAWVFGGMGSWNDMGFGGNVQVEYEKLSDMLFEGLNEAVEAAASSSMAA